MTRSGSRGRADPGAAARRRWRLDGRRAAWACAASILAHLAAALTLTAVTTGPSLDMSFELPAEVEFGLTEGMEAHGAGDLPRPGAPSPAAPRASGDGVANADAGMDAGPDAGRDDASVDSGRRRRRRRDGGRRRPQQDAGAADAAADAERDATPVDAGVGASDAGRSSRIPPGAQLAIRLDMQALRSSPIAPDVRRLLTAIPDWHALLDGSGIDPLADLDRLLLASPNLRRERMVLAGRHHRDRGYAEEATRRLAESQHAESEFHAAGAVSVAPWRNHDGTERVIALAGDHHFIICRPADLARVLALMHLRAEDARADGGAPPLDAAEALLDMPEGELMTFEIEGARRFLRAGDPTLMPTRGHLGARTGAGVVALRGAAEFEDEAQAARAREFWRAQLDRVATNPMVALTGLSNPLRRLRLEADEATLRFETELSIAQARLVLGYVEGMLVQYRRDRERRMRGARPGNVGAGSPRGESPRGEVAAPSMASGNSPSAAPPRPAPPEGAPDSSATAP